MSMAAFVQEKLRVATALEAGECGGTYVDAMVIMASLLSGIASDLWPGPGQDKKRFVELWTLFGEPGATRVSVPLLTQWLRSMGRNAEAGAIEGLHRNEFFWPGSTSVLVGEDVDLSDNAIQAVCPTISVRDLRRFSYPVLFYEHVRCAGVHEYQVGEQASAWAMTSRQANVSYVNRQMPGLTTRRHICFHGPWLRQLISSIVERVDQEPSPAVPASWWIDG